jgi:serine protease AprX
MDYTAAATNAGVAASYAMDGSGIGIAVIDSGLTPGVEFNDAGGKSRIVYREDFTGSGTANDLYGHGNHVAGIIAGNGTKSTGSNMLRTFKGPASGAKLIGLRVLDAAGQGTDSMVIAAIQRAIALKNTYKIRVINLSLGRPPRDSYTKDPLCLAVEAAYKAGIVVVVAAGNEGRNNNGGINGYGTILAPGNDPYVITVGVMRTLSTASRTDDLIASYSSKGPTLFDHVVKPDLVAPGNQVRSVLASQSATLYSNYTTVRVPYAYYQNSASTTPSPYYASLSGTSMATPVVSAAAALLLQQTPSMTPDQVKARLMKTAYKTFPATSSSTDPATGITYVSQYDMFTVGAGYLDIAAALANRDLSSGAARSPVAVFDANNKKVTLSGISGTGLVWGSGVVWGSGLVWGSNVVSSSGVVWGNGVVWGTGVVWGSGGLLGTAVVWGTTVLGFGPDDVVWPEAPLFESNSKTSQPDAGTESGSDTTAPPSKPIEVVGEN